MNINLHLTGELELFINELIRKGFAANKTEAVRLAITQYYEQFFPSKKLAGEEPLSQSTIEAHWNNPSDEKSSEFYTKRYLHGKA